MDQRQADLEREAKGSGELTLLVFVLVTVGCCIFGAVLLYLLFLVTNGQ